MMHWVDIIRFIGLIIVYIMIAVFQYYIRKSRRLLRRLEADGIRQDAEHKETIDRLMSKYVDAAASLNERYIKAFDALEKEVRNNSN